MKLVNRNWWKFWSEESGIVGAMIYGAVVGAVIVVITLNSLP
jgi:hypothetical protein